MDLDEHQKGGDQSTPHCANCKFWLGTGVVDGWCRRYPPKPVYEAIEIKNDPYTGTILGYDSGSFITTMTTKDYWCGEYVAK
jgi:hypothetical protein